MIKWKMEEDLYITEPHPSGDQVVFDAKRHIYFMQNSPKNLLVPSTTFVKRFFPKFDAKEVSLKYARKHDVSATEVREEWKEKRDNATDLGKSCHKYAQLLSMNVEEIPPYDKKLLLYFSHIKSTFKELYKKGYEVVGAEKIIASPSLNLAGTIDILFKKDKELLIGDWKTSENIKKYNPWQTALPPIEHLDDCNFFIYSLQLNIYKLILQKEGYFPWAKVYPTALVWIKEGGYEFIQVPDLTNEIKKMLEMQKKT